MCTVIIVNPNGSNLADSYLFLYLDIIFIAFSGWYSEENVHKEAP